MEASVELENALGSGDFNGFDAAEGTFALSQVIELGGKRDARGAAAQSGRELLAVERQVAQLDVLAEVTRRFIAVAAAQEQLCAHPGRRRPCPRHRGRRRPAGARREVARRRSCCAPAPR